MITNKLNSEALLAQINIKTDAFVSLITSTNENILDIVPFDNSWTVAQLASHVTKSIKGIAQAMEMPGKPAIRNAGERVEELRKMFLDYDVKYKSPEFILPDQTIYTRKEILEKIYDAINKLNNVSSVADLSEVISLPAFGEITKLELLNFVVFHTMRHTHQLKNILHTISNKN